MSPGVQLAQAIHAFREFVFLHQEVEKDWYLHSNTIVVLSVENESSLVGLMDKAWAKDIRYAVFREPDRQHEHTALALEPKAASLVRDLPLVT